MVAAMNGHAHSKLTWLWIVVGIVSLGACAGQGGGPNDNAPEAGSSGSPSGARTGAGASTDAGLASAIDSSGGDGGAPMATGALLWGEALWNGADVVGQSVTFGSSGNMLVSGYYGGWKFPIPLPLDVSTATPASFLGEYDGRGTAVTALSAYPGSLAGDPWLGVAPGSIDSDYLVFHYGTVHDLRYLARGQVTGKALSGGGPGFGVAVLKRDADGSIPSSVDLTSSNIRAIAGSPGGDVVVAGDFSGTLALDGTTLDSKGSVDILVARLDASLGIESAKSYGGSGDEFPEAIAVDASGRVVLAGTTSSDKLDLGCGASAPNGSKASVSFVVMYEPSGICKWNSFAHGARVTALAMDPQGGAVVAGVFESLADFGNGQKLTVPSGDRAGYVQSIDENGKTRWIAQFGTNGKAVASSIAMDPWQNVVVGGQFAGTMDIGNETYGSVSGDAFAAKLAPSGTPLWNLRFGDATGNAISGVAVDSKGNIGVVGTVVGQATIRYGAGATGVTQVGRAGGGEQALVMELAP